MVDNTIWFPTFTGKKIDIDNIDPDQICLEDIAHHLSGLNRWLNGTVRPYSVAEHSTRLSFVVPSRVAPLALLHDAHEYVTGDLPRPVKDWLNRNGSDAVAMVESLLDRTIFRKYKVDKLLGTPEAIDMYRCDKAMPVAEAYWAELIGHTNYPKMNGTADEGQRGLDFTRFLFDRSNKGVAGLYSINTMDYGTWGWTQTKAKAAFLERAKQLQLCD